ncbi:MAG: alpha/beta hydrolase [Syntrophaceae bacterium]
MLKVMRGNERELVIRSKGLELRGILGIPASPAGIVVFAHGSGSGRLSPRNNFVARVLQDAGMATLLSDLLQEQEESDRTKIFDIDLLADRLLIISQWLVQGEETGGLKLGYFGASTGAAAALQAAAREPANVAAIVSRGGRPDLALQYLGLIAAPTLLIVGGDDEPVIYMNREAYERLPGRKQLVIIPGASHLFEEPGALEKVGGLARDWFLENFNI